MQKYGMIKKYKTEDEDGKESELVLKANVLTYIVYKNFTGRELQSDILKALVTPNNAKLLEQLAKFGIDTKSAEFTGGQWISKLTDNQLDEIAPLLTRVIDSEFNINFIAALIATNDYPNVRDFEDTIMSMPPNMITDSEFLNDIYSLLTMFISGSKKK